MSQLTDSSGRTFDEWLELAPSGIRYEPARALWLANVNPISDAVRRVAEDKLFSIDNCLVAENKHLREALKQSKASKERWRIELDAALLELERLKVHVKETG